MSTKRLVVLTLHITCTFEKYDEDKRNDLNWDRVVYIVHMRRLKLARYLNFRLVK